MTVERESVGANHYEVLGVPADADRVVEQVGLELAGAPVSKQLRDQPDAPQPEIAP